MATREKLLTADEFFRFARLTENQDRRLELENGVLVDMAPSRPINSVTAGRMIFYLNGFVIPRNLGYVTVPDGGFILAPHVVRQPDAAFISKQKFPELPEEFTAAPDLAVEIVSEREDIFRKALEYLRAGTQMVWAVYADERTVYSLQLNEKGEMYSISYGVNATLEGGDVLPGFTVAVRDLFPE